MDRHRSTWQPKSLASAGAGANDVAMARLMAAVNALRIPIFPLFGSSETVTLNPISFTIARVQARAVSRRQGESEFRRYESDDRTKSRKIS